MFIARGALRTNSSHTIHTRLTGIVFGSTRHVSRAQDYETAADLIAKYEQQQAIRLQHQDKKFQGYKRFNEPLSTGNESTIDKSRRSSLKVNELPNEKADQYYSMRGSTDERSQQKTEKSTRPTVDSQKSSSFSKVA